MNASENLRSRIEDRIRVEQCRDRFAAEPERYLQPAPRAAAAAP